MTHSLQVRKTDDCIQWNGWCLTAVDVMLKLPGRAALGTADFTAFRTLLMRRIAKLTCWRHPYPPADSMDDYDDVPMSRADYGIDMSSGSASLASSTPSGGARVTSGLRSSESGPNLDHLSSNDLAAALSLGSLPLHSMQGGAGGTSGRHFLPYERRSLLGQASYNIGYSYFGGLLLGGLLGFANGIRVSPNMRFRVLLNRCVAVVQSPPAALTLCPHPLRSALALPFLPPSATPPCVQCAEQLR